MIPDCRRRCGFLRTVPRMGRAAPRRRYARDARRRIHDLRRRDGVPAAPVRDHCRALDRYGHRDRCHRGRRSDSVKGTSCATNGIRCTYSGERQVGSLGGRGLTSKALPSRGRSVRVAGYIGMFIVGRSGTPGPRPPRHAASKKRSRCRSEAAPCRASSSSR